MTGSIGKDASMLLGYFIILSTRYRSALLIILGYTLILWPISPWVRDGSADLTCATVFRWERRAYGIIWKSQTRGSGKATSQYITINTFHIAISILHRAIYILHVTMFITYTWSMIFLHVFAILQLSLGIRQHSLQPRILTRCSRSMQLSDRGCGLRCTCDIGFGKKDLLTFESMHLYALICCSLNCADFIPL